MGGGDSQARDDLAQRMLDALAGDGRTPIERQRLVLLMRLFADLPPPPDPGGHFPGYARIKSRFLDACFTGDGDLLEERFLELYCHVHMHEAPYTARERRIVDQTGGYWCHAGGLSPILKAGAFIRPDTVSADYGAGNGLQGLLIQWLDPHRRTIQIEVSREAVEIGTRLAAWIGIPGDRISWVVDDVRNRSPRGLDFIYLYRPLRPVGPGHEFYRRFSRELIRSNRPVVIFSVADCLRDYLAPAFEMLFTDGQLTCFRGPISLK